MRYFHNIAGNTISTHAASNIIELTESILTPGTACPNACPYTESSYDDRDLMFGFLSGIHHMCP